MTMIQVLLILTCSRAARGTLTPEHAQILILPNEVTTRNECTAVFGQSCGDMSKPKCKRTNGEVVITSPPIVHMREICTDITIPTFSCPSSEYKLMCNDGTLAWHVPAVVLSADCECTLPTISHGNTMVIVANADGSHPSMNGPSGNSGSEAASSDIHMEPFASSRMPDEQLTLHIRMYESLEYTYENSYWFLCGVLVPWATCVLFEIVHILWNGTSLMSSNLLVKIVPRDAYDNNDARNTKSINPRVAHVV